MILRQTGLPSCLHAPCTHRRTSKLSCTLTRHRVTQLAPQVGTLGGKRADVLRMHATLTLWHRTPRLTRGSREPQRCQCLRCALRRAVTRAWPRTRRRPLGGPTTGGSGGTRGWCWVGDLECLLHHVLITAQQHLGILRAVQLPAPSSRRLRCRERQCTVGRSGKTCRGKRIFPFSSPRPLSN